MTDMVRCTLGDVVDLSAAGVRLRCRKKPPLKPGMGVVLTLAFSGGKLQLPAQTRWVRRQSALRGPYDVGLRFHNISEAHGKVLESVAKFGFLPPPGATADRSESFQRPRERVRATVVLPEHYEALGLQPGASAAAIKHAYRVLAMQCHPDVNATPEAAEQFLRIKTAYSILTEAAKQSAAVRPRK